MTIDRRPCTRSRLVALVSALLALVWLPLAVAAQEESEVAGEAGGQETGVFTERVEVNVVTVDVVVTDREGRPVTGLTAADFEVFEDRQPMTVTNFYAVAGGERAAAPPAGESGPRAEAPATEPPTAPAVPAPAASPAKEPLHLIVFVDNVNIRGVNRKRVFQDLRGFLHESVRPGDRVMLVSYERSLKVRHGFISDPRTIANSLFELEELSTNTTQANDERRTLIRRLEELDSAAQARIWLRSHAQSVESELQGTLAALREMVDSLAGIPGRKALLYVSDGLPMAPGEEFFVAMQAVYPRESFILDSRGWDATSRFQQLASQANSNRVSFYTLDAAGVRVSSAIDVERQGGGLAGFHTTLDSATVANLHNSLKYMASATGGQAIVNTNNFRPGLDEMRQDFDSYYSLGYVAPHSGDGRYHTIEVRVKRDGVKTRHREGYRDKPLFDRMADSTLSTLRWGLGGNNKMGVRLAFLAATPGGEAGEALVPLVVEIPLKSVVLVPRGDLYEGMVRLYVAVADSRSRIAEPQELPVPIRIPAAEIDRAREEHFSYRIPLRMRTGGQRVAVGIRDEIGATDSFVTAEINVGSV